MKKIVAWLSFVAIIFVFCGCNTSHESLSDTPPVPSESTTTTTTTANTAQEDEKTTTNTRRRKTTSTKKTTRGCTMPLYKTTATVCTTQPTVAPQSLITHSLGKATLPLTGFCGMSADNKIIIQTDYIGYAHGELTPPSAAFAYRDGEMIQLKPFDLTLIVKKEFNYYNRTATVPMRYFVMDSTVYAYAMAWPDGVARFISIPNDSQHVLLTGGIVKRPIKVNVVTGTCEFLTEEYLDYSVFHTTIGENGAYVAMMAGTSHDIRDDSNNCQYVYHLQSGKMTKIPLPTVGDDMYFIPWCFVEDSLFIRCNDGPYNSDCTWYEFDVSTEKLKIRRDLSRYRDLEAEYRPYRYLLYQTTAEYATSGKLGVLNLKTERSNTVECRDNMHINSANASGDLVMTLDWDEKTSKRTYSFIDMQSGKEALLSDLTPDCVDGTYKGYRILGVSWCGERAVLINYTPEPDNPDQSRCLAEVFELPNW